MQNESIKKEEWWICEEDKCGYRLGKILDKDILDIRIIEITGKNGEKFLIKPNFIVIFCPKCGMKNIIYGGSLGSKKWENNLEESLKCEIGEDEFDFEEFFANSYKRNKLLRLLTENQKKLFSFLQNRKEKEVDFDEMCKVLDLSGDIVKKNHLEIYKKMVDINHEIRKRDKTLDK